MGKIKIVTDSTSDMPADLAQKLNIKVVPLYVNFENESFVDGRDITPNADPEDGILDVCIIKRMSKIHFIKVFPSVFKGEHISDPFVEYFRANEVEIDSDYNFSVFADGEYICKLPAKFEIAKKSLNFIAPKK